MNRCPKCNGLLNMRPIGFECRTCGHSSGLAKNKDQNLYSTIKASKPEYRMINTKPPTVTKNHSQVETRFGRRKEKFFFNSICEFIIDLFSFHKKYRYNQIVYRYYPKGKYSRKQIRFYRNILLDMDRAFTTYFDFNNNKISEFFFCPALQPDYKAKAIGIDYYRSDYARIKEEAVKRIEELLKLKNRYQEALKYYDSQILKAKNTKSLLESEQKFQVYYNKIYHQKMYTLDVAVDQCKKIIKQLHEKVHLCDEAIRELEKMKKPTFIDLILDTAAAIVTAPLRHGAELLGGIITGDGGKVIRSGALLGLGFFGVGAIADAIDVFEGLEGIDSFNPDTTALEFVDPHERILADGTSIWVDGDGDTSVNLSTEQGGGYLRR